MLASRDSPELKSTAAWTRNAKFSNLCTTLQRALAPDSQVTQIFFTLMYYFVQYTHLIPPGPLYIYQYYGCLSNSNPGFWVWQNYCRHLFKMRFWVLRPLTLGWTSQVCTCGWPQTHSFRTCFGLVKSQRAQTVSSVRYIIKAQHSEKMLTDK